MLVAVSKGLQEVKILQQNPPVVNWGCRLMQVFLYNGRKTVVVGSSSSNSSSSSVFISVKTVC